ncbi:MAG: VWA-like domain-containing protein [Sulfurovum sp.]|nr:VWA-like domain-containing protein [Sulfurovum sp.]
MTPEEKIAKAKAKLMLEHPYIGSIATVLKLDDNKETLTFNSDGVSLKYNDEYFEKAPLDEIEFALANGAMHAVLKHTHRRHDRVGRIWQAATDLAVNSMLVKNDFILPPYVYYDERFEGMYAEEIYDILKDEMIYNQTLDDAEAPTPDDAQSEEGKEGQPQNQEQNSQSPTENTQTSPPAEQFSLEEISKEEMEALQEELKEHFEQIFQKFNRQGELPKGMEILVPEYFSHKIHWRELLYRYIAEFAKSTYSFMPPNMKYLYRGICLPSLSSDLLRIVIAIDTSGSVDESLLGAFLSEVDGIMQSYGNYEIDLITADAKVQSHKVFLPGEMLDYTVSGGGGTDFRPVFEYIDREIDYPTLLLYFTDGMGTFPQNEPHYHVMWVMPEDKEVPFGEVLLLV